MVRPVEIPPDRVASNTNSLKTHSKAILPPRTFTRIKVPKSALRITTLVINPKEPSLGSLNKTLI